MIFRIPLLLLIAICIFPSAQALEPGDSVLDFVMLSENGSPQRLSEQIGKPVMLIWLDDCDACAERLIEWQYLAESRAVDDLITWFVWQPKENFKAPWARLPILRYRADNKEAWLFNPTPAVMLISPDGILDHLFLARLDERRTEVASVLNDWLKNKQWLQEGKE